MTNHWKRTIDLLLLMASMPLAYNKIYLESWCLAYNKIYLERKKCVTSITSFNAQHNKVSGKEDLFNALE